MEATLPTSQIGNIARWIVPHTRNLVLKRPRKQTSNRLDPHICGMRQITLAITKNSHRFGAHLAERKVSKRLAATWRYRLRPSVLQDLTAHMLCLRIELA